MSRTNLVHATRRTVATALERFDAYFHPDTPAKMHPNLRQPVFRAGIRHLGPRAVALLRDEYARAPAIDSRELVLGILGRTPDMGMVRDEILPFLFDADPAVGVAPGDMHTLASSLAANGAEARDMLWRALRERWPAQVAPGTGKLANPVVLDRFVKMVLSRHADAAVLAEIDAFFGPGGGGHAEIRAFARTLDAVKEQIRARSAYREREREVVRQWLRREGFLEGYMPE